MIYSASMFFNELDLLDLKVQETLPHVDAMFIIESELTHSGNRKGKLFPEDKYKDEKKIRYRFISEEEISRCRRPIDKEEHQYNAPYYMVDHYPNDDIWILTDLDEIIRGEEIPRIVSETKKHGHVKLEMDLHYYYINVMDQNPWRYPLAITGNVASETPFYTLRRRGRGKSLKGCGKHFSYLGGAEAISTKLKSFKNVEYGKEEFSGLDVIRKRMESLEDVVGRTNKLKVVEIDDTYPRTILNNLDRWKRHIYTGSIDA